MNHRHSRANPTLPPDHPAWEEVADVMAHALMNLTLSICPKRIILGGGAQVMDVAVSVVPVEA